MKGEHRQSEETGWVGGEETLVWDNVVGGQNPPRKGCSRAILRGRENKVREMKEMRQEDRGDSAWLRKRRSQKRSECVFASYAGTASYYKTTNFSD